MRTIGQYLLALTGFLACPCHLPLTLPILAALLGGTSLGTTLTAHIDLLSTIVTGYFVVAVLLGVRLIARG